MAKGGSSAPAPDPKIGEAALLQAKTGEDWLNFAKDAFTVSNSRQADLDALTKEVSQRQLGLAENQQKFTKDITDKQFGLAQRAQDLTDKVTGQQLDQSAYQFDIAKQDRQRYEKTFRPIEDQFVQEASNYSTPEKQAESAAEAKADVQTSAAAAKAAAQRDAASLGINPASGRYAGIDRAGELGTALATAGAANTARQAVRDKGLALKADVANLGRGLPAQSAQAAALGLNASNSALGGANANAGVGLNVGNAAIGNMGNAAQLGINANGLGLSGAQAANAQFLASTDLMGSGFRGAMAGYAGEANTLQNQYNSQLNAWSTQQQINAQNASGIGSAIGGIAGLFFSDENLKENKEALPDGAALDAIEKMPVESWKYKDGVADGGEHIGTYAQDFQRETGKGDGHTIAAQDAIGITMKAVQDLNAKVDKVAAAIGLGDKRERPAKKNTKMPIGLGIAA